MPAFFFVLTLAAGCLFLHPFVFYPLSLRLLKRQPVMLDNAAPTPSATLVFCAFNEEAALPSKIENLRQARAVAPHLKFLAYVDKSTDRTLEILNENADLIPVVAATQRTGKAVGMRILVDQIDTDIVIFTDANALLDPNSIDTLLRYFSDPLVGGVAATLTYTNADEGPVAGTGSAYWRLEEFIKQGESRKGSTMGADGSLFALRRNLYPIVPDHLMDDLIASMAVVFAGSRLVSAPDVFVYERSATSSEDEFRRKRRIACRAYSIHRHIAPSVGRLPPLDRYKYTSHRVLRWLSGFSGGACMVFAVLFITSLYGFLSGVFLAALLAGAYVLGSKLRVPVLSHVVEIGRAIAAATLGVIDSWRGRTYQTWQPPVSR
jgi:cellulose synthase/poly-beta-1,6-N-acetylglucosamine synthase-like glycosyltransferase